MKFLKWNEQFYEALSSCPSCKSDDLDVKHFGNDNSKRRKITIKCNNCRIERTDAAIKHGFDWLEEVAVKAWNHIPN